MASPSLTRRAYGTDTDLIEPDESESTQIAIAKLRLGDPVSDIVTSPNDSDAYVALHDSIAVIDSLHDVSRIIPVSGHPRGLTIDAAGTRLYVRNHGDSVSMIDLADYRVDVMPGVSRVQRVETVGGTLMYAAGSAIDGSRCGGGISVIDADGATVAAIAGLDGRVVTNLASGPEGNRVYAGWSRQSAYYQYDVGFVTVIDTTANAVIHTIDLGASPDTITVSPDGSMLYAAHYDHKLVSAVDLTSGRVTPIRLGAVHLE